MRGLKYSSFALLIFLIISSYTNAAVTFEMPIATMINDSGHQMIFTASYTPHDPIVIMNNSDFVSQGWAGNGTEEEPFVIENLSISNQSECISISNTDVYFEIRDCLISASSQSGSVGIMIDNVTHGMVMDCNIENHYYGVYLASSSNCTLTSNIATFGYWGYYLYLSSSVTLINNTVSNFEYGFTVYLSTCSMQNNTANYNAAGYHLYEASFCNLTDNHASGNGRGFTLHNSTSCTLTNNSAYDNYISDFNLSFSLFCTLTNNTGWSNGLRISGFSLFHWLHNISGTVIRNKPLGYFKSANNLIIDGEKYSQIILVNCSSIVLTNGMFNNVVTAVQLVFCTSCTLTNNTCTENPYDGFKLWLSPNCVLSNNTSTSNHNDGFELRSSPNCTLTNNIATSNYYGFYLDNCSSSTLTNNLAFNNDALGFRLGWSSSCTFTNNTAQYCSYGINLYASDSCALINNTVSDNLTGFFLSSTNSSSLTKNVCMNNDRGIRLTGSCTENLIFLNQFFLNSEYNANDDGFSNYWDNGTHGNFWDDYDGIGSYNISGSAGSMDNYPDGMIHPDNPVTTPTTPVITTSTTTSLANDVWFLEDLLVIGISTVSATIIGVVLILTVRARRTAKTWET